MVHENGTLDATLAAAAGDDPALLAELRAAFVESLERQIDLLGRARCDGNWEVAALRLKGLAASFHAGPLLRLAEDAIAAAPGDPVILRKLRDFTRSFSAGSG
ncbi:Hpt domain-containing protein [Pelagerythrobacter marensis]|uniref:Hpt domain-containing protein n=1 Tax=Pelagerythrobacter marensis TaxID=543877 RepID=A0ABZ2D3E6_9SPHN